MGRALIIVVLVGAVAMLAACSRDEDDAYLSALRADPLASYSPPSTELDVNTEQARADPSSTSKGQQAQILRSYRSDDPASTAAAMEALVARAQESGWQLDFEYERGSILTRPGPASSTMRLTVATSTDTPTKFSVSMTAG